MRNRMTRPSAILATLALWIPLGCGPNENGNEGPMSLAATSSTLKLSWQDNADNEDGFHVERCEGDACEEGGASWSQLAKLATDATSHTDDTVEAGTQYCYRVRAFNSAGESAWSNTACGKLSEDGAGPDSSSADDGGSAGNNINDNDNDSTGNGISGGCAVGATPPTAIVLALSLLAFVVLARRRPRQAKGPTAPTTRLT